MAEKVGLYSPASPSSAISGDTVINIPDQKCPSQVPVAPSQKCEFAAERIQSLFGDYLRLTA